MTLFRSRQIQNIFSDHASQVLRALLREPQRKWTVPDLTREGVSAGLASMVLNKAEARGYVNRVRLGPGSYTQLADKKALLADWTRAYAFERNPHVYLHYPKDDFLERCTALLRKKGIAYALTLFSASRQISPYVRDQGHFLYLDLPTEKIKSPLRFLESQLGLLRLARGGNVCFALPFYQSSVFREAQPRKGHPTVSPLQLWLDLQGYPPSGPEEAAHLLTLFKEEGIPFAQP